jgi:hypothetical protein
MGSAKQGRQRRLNPVVFHREEAVVMRKSPFTISAVGVFLVAFLTMVQAQNITTLAGGGPNNLSSNISTLGTPWAVVQDAKGNTYISDNLSNRVFKVNGSGILTVAAGDIVPNYNANNHGDNNPATAASLAAPQGIALDSNGILYIADTGNNAVRVVNTQNSAVTVAGVTIPAGVIETIAGDGSGTPGFFGDGGPATSALLNGPSGVWLDADNNLYIADTLNSRVRVVNTQATTIQFPGTHAPSVPPGDIATIVGTGTAGFGDGPIATAEINLPDGIFVTGSATAGTVVIVLADTANNRVRAVNTQAATSASVAGVSILAGNIVTVAGNGTAGYMGDTGIATIAELNHPSAVITDNLGNLYIADGDNLPQHGVNTSNEVIRLVNSSNIISTFAGTNGTQCSSGILPCGDGGPATSANLWAPTGVFVSGAGNLLIADQNDDAIREVSGGNIQTVMGVLLNTSYAPFPVTLTSPATNAALRRPAGVASDAAGNAYIADTFNNAIRKVNASGTISTLVGDSLPCNTQNCGDGGPASQARVTSPFDVAFDNASNLYIADSGDNVIRVVNNQSSAITIAGQTIQPGTIVTVAGNGTPCTSTPCGDGGTSTTAQLNSPEGLFVDNAGNIFIADTNDNAIRVVNSATVVHVVAGVTVPAGAIVTVAGAADPNTACTNPIAPACGDTGPATSALLNGPGGVGFDSLLGNIYLADTGDNRVRFVNGSGIINAFAGTGVACTSDCKNGGPALNALLDAPQNLFVDLAGNVFIADSFDYEVRDVTTDGNIHGVAGNETRGFSGDGGAATSAQLDVPFGVSGDPFGNLLIADIVEWRVRKVSRLVVTEPRADLSGSQLAFSDQPVHTTSAARAVTVTNDGFGNSLTFTNDGTLSGANASDYAIASNTCTGSLPAGSFCTISITFSPTAKGGRVATLTITDNADGVPGTQQSVALSGTGLEVTALGEQVDYFGEGTADFTVWRPANGTWYSLDSSGNELTKPWGASTDIPVIGDFDGDGKTDFGVFRPADGTWFILQSSNGKEVTKGWGIKGDIPVPGDYDGDGKTDFAIFRPSNATWYIIQSSNGQVVTKGWGAKGDIAVPGDYDGDGKTDLAVFRPSNATWYIIQSSNGQVVTKGWGAKGDIPVPADYDGDGKTDLAVFRPSNGTWYVIQSSNGQIVTRGWGTKGDVPVARDYDGDGKADFAVWRPSNATWYVIESRTGNIITKPWGASTDIPMNKAVGQ